MVVIAMLIEAWVKASIGIDRGFSHALDRI